MTQEREKRFSRVKSASAPAAANVTQIAQVYGHGGDYAGAINVITTLLCIGTMPLTVLLYQM